MVMDVVVVELRPQRFPWEGKNKSSNFNSYQTSDPEDVVNPTYK